MNPDKADLNELTSDKKIILGSHNAELMQQLIKEADEQFRQMQEKFQTTLQKYKQKIHE